MDHHRVAEGLVLDADGPHDVFDVMDLQVGHRKTDLHLEQISKNAEAGIENDIAHFDNHFTGGLIQFGSLGPVSEQTVQEYGGRFVEQEDRVAGDRTAEKL